MLHKDIFFGKTFAWICMSLHGSSQMACSTALAFVPVCYTVSLFPPSLRLNSEQGLLLSRFLQSGTPGSVCVWRNRGGVGRYWMPYRRYTQCIHTHSLCLCTKKKSKREKRKWESSSVSIDSEGKTQTYVARQPRGERLSTQSKQDLDLLIKKNSVFYTNAGCLHFSSCPTISDRLLMLSRQCDIPFSKQISVWNLGSP